MFISMGTLSDFFLFAKNLNRGVELNNFIRKNSNDSKSRSVPRLIVVKSNERCASTRSLNTVVLENKRNNDKLPLIKRNRVAQSKLLLYRGGGGGGGHPEDSQRSESTHNKYFSLDVYTRYIYLFKVPRNRDRTEYVG